MSVRHLIPETAGLINAARSVAPIVAVVSEDEPRDGVTTVSCNLATELVAMRRSVAVVDCDFADPQLHERLDQPLGAGFAAVLAGDAQIEQVFSYRATSGGKFLAVTAGEHHVRRAPLLGAPTAAEAVWRLSELADIVLLTSAPLTTPVGQNLVALADSVVLVGSAPAPLGPEQRPALLPGASPYVAARVADPGAAVRRRPASFKPERPRPGFDVPDPRRFVRRPAPSTLRPVAIGPGVAAVEATPRVDVGAAVEPAPLGRPLPAPAADAGRRGLLRLPSPPATFWDVAPLRRKRRFYHSPESRYLD